MSCSFLFKCIVYFCYCLVKFFIFGIPLPLFNQKEPHIILVLKQLVFELGHPLGQTFAVNSKPDAIGRHRFRRKSHTVSLQDASISRFFPVSGTVGIPSSYTFLGVAPRRERPAQPRLPLRRGHHETFHNCPPKILKLKLITTEKNPNNSPKSYPLKP
uniref:Uncharacterized protein MANES_01G107600 n=1 Tax=Rhizophora mucronata TaxID=61149 RepID=A0A2P2MH34_RHIMU